MPTVSELTVVLSADTKDLDAGLAKAEKSVGGFGDSIKSGLGMGLGFGLIGTALSAAGSAIGALKGSVIDLNGSLEQSQIAFTTMLGSAEKSTAFLDELQKFAAATPFAFPDLVDASKRMLAFGFESKNVVPLLTAVGDAVAAVGGGKETIDGVTTALGQMQAKGKVSAEEMGQLAERGIPAWDMLAKQMGVSVAEAMDAVSKGQVKAGTFLEAFQKGSAERFGGMMEKQSMTFSGAMSTITDSLTMATAKAFKPFFDLLSEGAIMLSKFVQSETFNAWAASVSAAIVTVVDSLRSLTSIGAILNDALAGNMSTAVDKTLDVLSHFGDTLVKTVEDWAPIIGDWVKEAGVGLIDNLGDMWIKFEDWIQDTGISIVENLATWAAAFLDWVGPMIPDLLRDLGGLLVKIGVWIVTDALPTLVTKLAEWGLALVEWIGPRIVPMLTELGKLELELLTWLITTALPAIVGKLAEWAQAFIDWVAPLIPPLLVEAGKLLLGMTNWMIVEALPELVGKLVEWGAAFIGWIAKDVLPKLPGALAEIISAIGSWITERVGTVAENAAEMGRSFIRGIQNGIASALGAFWQWLQTNFVDRIPETIRNILGLQHDTGTLAQVGARMVDELKIGIQNRWPSLEQMWSRLGSSFMGGGAIVDYIAQAAIKRGIDPTAALAVAQHEGLADPNNPMAVGKFRTGWSFWPFQLHYGGRGYEHFGDTAGMGNDFTRATGWQPGDPRAWMASTDWALDWAQHHGWGAWYGRGPAGVGAWQGIPGHAAGGWVGLHGPELGVLGERGPEYIVPNRAMSGIGAVETVRVEIAVGGRVAEEIYVTGRALAVRRGRVPGTAA